MVRIKLQNTFMPLANVIGLVLLAFVNFPDFFCFFEFYPKFSYCSDQIQPKERHIFYLQNPMLVLQFFEV